jgi:hypothetical protein
MIYLPYISHRVNYILAPLFSTNKQKEVKKIPNQYFILSDLKGEEVTQIKKEVTDHLCNGNWKDFVDWKINQWIIFMEYLIELKNSSKISDSQFYLYLYLLNHCLNYLEKRNYYEMIKNEYQIYFEKDPLDRPRRWGIHME